MDFPRHTTVNPTPNDEDSALGEKRLLRIYRCGFIPNANPITQPQGLKASWLYTLLERLSMMHDCTIFVDRVRALVSVGVPAGGGKGPVPRLYNLFEGLLCVGTRMEIWGLMQQIGRKREVLLDQKPGACPRRARDRQVGPSRSIVPLDLHPSHQSVFLGVVGG